MAYSKYKDADPLITEYRAKKAHESLGIKMNMEITRHSDGLFSSILSDDSGGWITCGKGTTAAYCVASAYGESIEHLCNYTAYDMQNLSEEAQNWGGFSFYPDETRISIYDIPRISPDVFKDLVWSYNYWTDKDKSNQKLLKLIRDYFKSDTIESVPFYSVQKKEILQIPNLLLSNLCGSNGGGAGNSPYEALGHAFDEITERYAKEQIYHQRLTPPEIPRKWLSEHCPELTHTILKLEQDCTRHFKVLDASLGIGLPVVCVLMTDTSKHEYIANFGAHPQFNIALERCLTEMFQMCGTQTDFNKRKKPSRWEKQSDSTLNGVRNWVSLLKDDVGVIPNEFFAGEPNWEFKPWGFHKSYSNEFGAKLQLNNLLSLSKDVYIRDNSIFGLYAYRVYVPGISTSKLPFDEQILASYKLCKNLPLLFNSDVDITISQKKDLCNLVFSEDMYIGSLVLHNVDESLYNTLYAALLWEIGEKKKSLCILKEQGTLGCDVAIKVAELIESGTNPESIRTMINLFYDSSAAKYGLCWLEKEIFLTYYKNYILKRKTMRISGVVPQTQDALNKLHIQLKKSFLEHPINQLKVGELFKNNSTEQNNTK